MTYPFNCKICGEIELELKPSQIPLKECPICGCKEIERIFQPIQSLWKCSGAYSKSNHGASDC